MKPTLRLISDVTQKDDRELLAECSRGNTAALGELFDRYHLEVYRFVSRLSGTDERERDDLVQVTFLEVQKAAGSFDGRSSAKSWLFGIAANMVKHHVRSEVRRKRLAREAEEVEPTSVKRPDRLAEHHELAKELSVAINALPHDLRVVFVACEVEDLPGSEVARTLGIPEGTLWRRLHESRKALRVLLQRRTP